MVTTLYINIRIDTEQDIRYDMETVSFMLLMFNADIFLLLLISSAVQECVLNFIRYLLVTDDTVNMVISKNQKID